MVIYFRKHSSFLVADVVPSEIIPDTEMALLLLSSILLGLFIAWIVSKSYFSPLRHIPGPGHYPVIGSLLSLDLDKYHQNLLDFYQKYGPVVRLVLPQAEVLAISGYDEIKKVLVTSGIEFGGRPKIFRWDYVFKNTGVLANTAPDSTWKALRSISHKHIKQFGDGLPRIEQLAKEIGSFMFEIFRAYNDEALDPHDHIFDAALMNVTYLITGVLYKLSHPFIEKMRKLEWSIQEYMFPASKVKYMMYDLLPSLRHLNLSSWADIENMSKLVDEV